MGFVPPLEGAAVKVTDVPGQTSLTDGETETDAVRRGLTVIETILLVAVTGAAQTAFDVKVTLTWSPFDSELVENEPVLDPTLAPFTVH